MTPLALNAALAACLGAGAVDLALLNLAVMPALYPAQPARVGAETRDARAADPERTPGPTKPAALLASHAAAPEAEAASEPSVSEPANTLTLVAVLEFEPASHHLDARARVRLRRSLAALRDARRIVIVGHTDESGTEAFNDRLSRERAEATLRQLVTRAIPDQRVELVARGERELLASGNSRRVEIFRGGEP